MSTTVLHKKPAKTGLRRPLSATALRRGRELAARYQVVIWFVDGEYFGHGMEIPGAMEDGKTADECFRKVRESMAECVALMIEMGQTPPEPQADADGNVDAIAYARATIARGIIQDRRRLGLSQEELAKLARVRQETISRIETCKVSPTRRIVAKLDAAMKRAKR